jgi:hypothetical protein
VADVEQRLASEAERGRESDPLASFAAVRCAALYFSETQRTKERVRRLWF